MYLYGGVPDNLTHFVFVPSISKCEYLNFKTAFIRKLMSKLISASFKMFSWKKWKSKSLTNSRDFYPDPPNGGKLKSSVFWMN